MSVRYTATWYDVMQAHRHTSIAVCRPRIAGRAAGFLAVPARPAGLQLSVLSHSHTLSSIAETGSWDSVCWCDRVKMAPQCVVICS